MLWLMLQLLLAFACQCQQFSSYSGRNFTHMELFSIDGRELVLVASKNGLLRLSADLSTAALTKLGPLNDSENCTPLQINQGKHGCNLAPTDNYIRATRIVNNSRLYFCMSYLSGSCASVQLVSLERPMPVNTTAVSAMLSSSVGSLLCRNPESGIFLTVSDRSLGGGRSDPDALYLTMPFCIPLNEPTLAIVDPRTLQKYSVTDTLNSFPVEIVPRRDFTRPGGLTHHASFRRVSRAATGWRSCVYFVLTAYDGASRQTRIRLARLCSDDLNLSNYVETFIDCGCSGSDDCVGAAAAVITAGNHLAKLLNISLVNDAADLEVLLLTSRVNGQNFVCSVSMATADQLLDAILDDCRVGRSTAYYGPAYLREKQRCSQPSGPMSGPASRRGGPDVVSWAGVFSTDRLRVLGATVLVHLGNAITATSIDAVATTRGDTLVYVGTFAGRVFGYRVNSTSPFFVAQLRGGSSVLAVRTGRNRIFALTGDKVFSQPYADCERQFHSCSDCLATSNPHCLWSNLPGTDGGCRTVNPHESIYATAAPSSLSYLTNIEQCSKVTSISGENIDFDRLSQSGNDTHTVTATVLNVPQGLNLFCHLEDGSTDDAEVASVGYRGASADVTCKLRTDRLRQYLGDLTSRQLKLVLSVNRQSNRPNLATSGLQVFTCSRHASCGSCASADSSRCGWCIAEGVCRAVDSTNCRRDDSPTKEALIASSSDCPRVGLSNLSSRATPVLPSGATENQLGDTGLLYSASGLQPYMRQFRCVVTCPGARAVNLPAGLQDNGRQLKCHLESQIRLVYASDSLPNVTCSVRFYWTYQTSESGIGRQLDADGPASGLALYKCENMAGSCDACVLSLPQRWGCVWCGDTCSVASACSSSSRVQHGGLCANPQLSQVRPSKLAPRPNLRLRVDGSNLGNSPASLSASLIPTIASAQPLVCRVESSSYQPGHTFECYVDEAPLENAGDYRLEVKIVGFANGATATAVSDLLPVRLPSVTAVYPESVQRSGRVEVRLSGMNLDAGSDLFVTWRPVTENKSVLNSDVNADEVLDRVDDRLLIKLGVFAKPGIYRPILSIQGHVIETGESRNVSLLKVMPDAELSIAKDELRSGLIPAGGLDFVISGKRLSVVRRAVLKLVEVFNSSETASNRTEKPQVLEAACQFTTFNGAVDVERFICTSPAVPQSTSNNNKQRRRRSVANDTLPVRRFAATVLLDDLSHPYPTPVLTVFPNPALEPMRQMPEVLLASASEASQSRQLRLLGRDFFQSVKPGDIRVLVGPATCDRVTVIKTSENLNIVDCQFRLSETDLGRALRVRATIGYLNFDLGHVTYAVEFPWIYVYIAAGIGSVLLIALAIACCIHLQQHSRKRRDKVNGIEVHLNNLEAKVSKSCREAFAELQLNSTPDGPYWTEDPTAPVPVRTYGQFAAYSCFAERYKDRFRTNDYLFADVATEDAANGHDTPEVRKSLVQLRHLLLNEDFLLALISALESRKDSFLHQERNHFGSLVSALLFSDPSYFTRILTVLIRQLIERKRDAQDNCKVTFRRCDSVAERLLPNWLAFQMYDYLAGRVAEPLYRLNREMRLQIYRGPVDQVTEDSRYTINEQKLLKKEITFRTIILIFHDRLRQFGEGAEPLQCKVPVLDCDTVRQAKEKILDVVYSRLRVPASRRLLADHFDLVRIATPAVAGDKTSSAGRPQADSIHVLTEVDDSDSGSDGTQRLRRMSCLNLGDNAASNNNGGGGATPLWVYLRPRKPTGSSIESTRRGLCKGASYADIGSLPSGVSSKSLQDMKHISSSYSRLSTAAPRQYHLIQPSGPTSHTLDRSNKKRRHGGRTKRSDAIGDGDNQQIVSEALYPILLSTKKNLVNKITALFAALFPTEQELRQLKRLSSVVSMEPEQQQQQQAQQQIDIPHCVVYLFDLLDQLANKDGGADVAHVWKSNALMLRFYTHHLLNVEYLLDVDVPGPVRYCMSTVSTLFMDACSAEQPKKPDKTSTAQRLLFYSEISCLHQRVNAYYASVQKRCQTRDSSAEDLLSQPATSLTAQSQPLPPPPRDCRPFNAGPLLKELFVSFVFKYFDDVIRHLQQQQPMVSDSLIASLQSIALVLSSESPVQTQQQQQPTLTASGSRDRKKRSTSRPALDSNAYEF